MFGVSKTHWFGAVLLTAAMTTLAFAQGKTQDKTVPKPDKPASQTATPPAVKKPAKQPRSIDVPVAKPDELVHDFGDVWASKQLQHAFTIANTGDAPLKIIKVKPSCGCTKAAPYPKELAPGASGKFSFRLNTKKINGKFTKSILVTTNDPNNRQIRLTLTGKVKHLIDVKPRLAQFGRIKNDSVLTRKITIVNNSEETLSLTLVEQQDLGCFKVAIEETKPGKAFELIITASPPFKTGINRTTLKIASNFEKQKTLEVICMATMPKRIELRPDKLQVVSNSRASTPRRIMMTNNGDTPVNILEVISTDEKVTTELKVLEAGKRQQITVTFPKGYTPQSADTAIVLKTDDAASPEIRIPIKTINRKSPRKRAERPAAKMLGQDAPRHQTKAHGGSDIQVGGKSDKVQFVTFYASWCGFCKRALPKIEGLQEKYKDNKNVEIVVVNLDDRTGRRGRTEEQTVSHYQKLGLTMPLVLDPEKKIGQDYKVTSFPTMFVIGKSGKVEAVHVGAAKGFEKSVEKEILTLLKGKSLRTAAPPATAVKPKPLPVKAARLTRKKAHDPVAPAKKGDGKKGDGKKDGGK